VDDGVAVKRLAFLVACVAGCFPSRSGDFVCQKNTDCPSDRTCDRGFCVLGSSDASPGDDGSHFDCSGFDTRHFMGCAIPMPTGPLALMTAGKYTLDTSAGTLLDPSNTPVTMATGMIDSGRVISVESFSLGTGVTLRVTGSTPLVVASWSTITVDGVIDMSSSIANGTGAGANASTCATRTGGNGNDNNSGAGGGAGGGFQDVGGRGGNGNGNNNGGGTPGALIAMPLLAGGCAGGNGGTGQVTGGLGGAGGGAIQLTSKGTLDVTGTIHAGGSGGHGALAQDAGGGGGGGGGMIGLDGTTVTVHAGAILAANGGGGGGGSEQSNSQDGKDATANATQAAGGVGNNAGDGGKGSAGATLKGAQGVDSPNHGGGGGGGAAGFIVVHGTATVETGTTVSPKQTTAP
jgi:hypothetical protein